VTLAVLGRAALSTYIQTLRDLPGGFSQRRGPGHESAGPTWRARL